MFQSNQSVHSRTILKRSTKFASGKWYLVKCAENSLYRKSTQIHTTTTYIFGFLLTISVWLLLHIHFNIYLYVYVIYVLENLFLYNISIFLKFLLLCHKNLLPAPFAASRLLPLCACSSPSLFLFASFSLRNVWNYTQRDSKTEIFMGSVCEIEQVGGWPAAEDTNCANDVNVVNVSYALE